MKPPPPTPNALPTSAPTAPWQAVVAEGCTATHPSATAAEKEVGATAGCRVGEQSPRETCPPVASHSPRRLGPLSDVVASSLADTGWDFPFSNERLTLLLQHIEAGYPLRTACGLCGLDESAYDRWCHGCPDISRAIDVAVESARAPAIDAILAKARSGDARAWTTWLRYSHKGVVGSSEMRPLGAKRSKHLLEGGNMVFPGELPRLRKAYEDFTEDGVSRAFVSPGLAARYASPNPQHGPAQSPAPEVNPTQAQVVTSLKLELGVNQPQADALPDPNPFIQKARPTSPSEPCVNAAPAPALRAQSAAVPTEPFSQSAARVSRSQYQRPSPIPGLSCAAAAAILCVWIILAILQPTPSHKPLLATASIRSSQSFSTLPHLPDPVYPVPI